jgi:adenine/guanine phosphoribosyltransferase-like PRPP-binding protein
MNSESSSFFFWLQDVANEIMREMQAKPDLIIGNYSDGNLVATLLAHKLGVTQVCLVVNHSFKYFFH